MISLEAIQYIKQLLFARGITTYYMDVLQIPVSDQDRLIYTDANRSHLYLLTHQLPQELWIASETSVLNIDASWANKGITKVQEFTGQLAISLPENHGLNQLEFIRAIPNL